MAHGGDALAERHEFVERVFLAGDGLERVDQELNRVGVVAEQADSRCVAHVDHVDGYVLEFAEPFGAELVRAGVLHDAVAHDPARAALGVASRSGVHAVRGGQGRHELRVV